MQRLSVQMSITLPPALYKKAMEVAKREYRSQSEIVREALRDYVFRKETTLAARKELAKSLRSKGVRTFRDIERMVDEKRA